jgi:hypothetical protein
MRIVIFPDLARAEQGSADPRHDIRAAIGKLPVMDC